MILILDGQLFKGRPTGWASISNRGEGENSSTRNVIFKLEYIAQNMGVGREKRNANKKELESISSRIHSNKPV